MKFLDYKKIFLSKKWLILVLAIFILGGTYTKAVDFVKDPGVGVMLPANDYEPAWYINPKTKEKIVLVEPIDAYRVMKKFGIGIKSSTLKKYFRVGFPKNLAGSILIDIQNNGQAYYISTLNNKAYFLGHPNFAFVVLKENGFQTGKKDFKIKTDNPLSEIKKEITDNKAKKDDPGVDKQPEELKTENIIVTTNPIKELSGYSKIINVSGKVLNDSGLVVSERGVVFGLTTQPSLENNKGLVKAEKQDDSFSVNIDNIEPGRTYYFKAYVLSGEKVFYGNEETFISPNPPSGGGSSRANSFPTIATTSLSITGLDSLSVVGQISDDGGGAITGKGVCWSSSTGPVIGNNCSNNGSGKDEFTSNISGLDPETIYYVRAYATNSVGTSYGNELITCGGKTVNDSEGNTYNVVKIGSQCWLKENLNIGVMVGAALADNVTVQGQSNDSVIEKFCYGYVQQDNVAQIATGTANCATDGGLYQWPEAMGLPYDCKNASSVDNGDGTYTLNCPISGNHVTKVKQRGICPSGWHIPTINEYQILSQRADPGCDLINSGCITAGGKLKVTALNSPIAWDGTDIYNFSIMPTGYLYYLTFSHHRDHAPFWTSLPDLNNPLNSWGFGLTEASSIAYMDPGNNRTDGFAVRCIKD